jgi:hypothetical protein
LKTCSKCGVEKPLDSFRLRKDTGKHRSDCRHCENRLKRGKGPIVPQVQVCPASDTPMPIEPRNHKTAKEEAMKRMLSAAKQRAKEKNLMFDIHYEDIQIPNLCPVLRIPLIPSLDGNSDNSPSLDRKIPYLGYTKGNVQVISMRANRIKSDATSSELMAICHYVRRIEEENI